MTKKVGILLVNLGTPDSPKTSDVRKYLIEFLTDGRVIDIPWLQRQLLVRGIIGPFRAPKSAKTYQEIWDDNNGSPLLYYGKSLTQKVQSSFDAKSNENVSYHVELAMRYQNPSIPFALQKLQQKKVDEIIVFPLFPQYASATTGSVHQKVMETISKWWEIPSVKFISSYYDYEPMIEIFANNGKKYISENFDHVLFSFHGLPESQLLKADTDNYCIKTENCCSNICKQNKMCYSAQCFATAKAIAKKCNLKQENYTICFQSRLGKAEWIKPYASDVIENLAKQGVKRLLVFSPAFVADCIETTFEIGVEYQEEFENAGGDKIQLVESLNDSNEWANAITDYILTSI